MRRGGATRPSSQASLVLTARVCPYLGSDRRAYPVPQTPYLAFWTPWSSKHLTDELSPGGWCQGGCVPGGKNGQVSGAPQL